VNEEIELLTRHQAAKVLKITPDQVSGLAQDGKLRYVNVGRGKKRPSRRYTQADLADYIEANRQRDVTPCLSINRNVRPSTATTLRSEVIGFAARRNAQQSAKPRR
jgi:hypothetical protein